MFILTNKGSNFIAHTLVDELKKQSIRLDQLNPKLLEDCLEYCMAKEDGLFEQESRYVYTGNVERFVTHNTELEILEAIRKTYLKITEEKIFIDLILKPQSNYYKKIKT